MIISSTARTALEQAELDLSNRPLTEVLRSLGTAALTPDQLDKATAITRDLVTVIAEIEPEPLCLPQAVALQRLLADQQISCRLTFGYLPKSDRNSTSENIPHELRSLADTLASRDAHVWVDAMGPDGIWQTLLGGETAQAYHVIGHYPLPTP